MCTAELLNVDPPIWYLQYHITQSTICRSQVYCLLHLSINQYSSKCRHPDLLEQASYREYAEPNDECLGNLSSTTLNPRTTAILRHPVYTIFDRVGWIRVSCSGKAARLLATATQTQTQTKHGNILEYGLEKANLSGPSYLFRAMVLCWTAFWNFCCSSSNVIRRSCCVFSNFSTFALALTHSFEMYFILVSTVLFASVRSCGIKTGPTSL